MPILVTGGAGYIGSQTVHELHELGEPVIVLDNLSTGLRRLLPSDVPLFVGDTSDPTLAAALIDAFSIDAVIHFAASIIVPESVQDPLRYYRNNTLASSVLLRSAAERGVKFFIFSSTAAVYGEPETVPIDEDAPTQPLSPYGTSKLMTEMMLRDAAAAYGLRYVTLRYFNVAGADPRLRTGQCAQRATHLIRIATQTALGLRAAMKIYGTDYPTRDGTCIRDYIHVADLARAHAAALAYLRDGGRSVALNCGYGRGFSVREVVDLVRRVSGRDFLIEIAERRPGDPAQLVAGVTKIRETLNWRPRFDDLERIISDALAWERKDVQDRVV